jgi:hypothetical protein
MKMAWIRYLLLAGLGLSLLLPCIAHASAPSPLPAIGASNRWFYYPDSGTPADEPKHPPLQPDHEALIAQGKTDFYHPSVAAGGMIVWYAQGTEGMDVLGVHLNADGSSPGGDPIVIADGPGDQALPFVASDARQGGYLVVWHDQRDGTADVYARYLDSEGRPQGDPFVISDAQGDQLRPTAAYVTAANGFLVVWQDSRLGGAPDVYARLVPSYSASQLGGGTQRLGKEFVVSAAVGGQFIPTAACETARPQCLVVWQDDRHAATLFTDVVGRLVNAAGGATIGDEIDVAVASNYQYSPMAVFNPVSAEYLVVWDDDISARRVSLAGQPLGSKVQISLESPHQFKPAVAVAKDGTYLIAWEDLRNLDTRGADIYVQWLSADGRPLGANLALSSDRHNQYSPVVVAGQGWGPKDVFVVWEDDRAAGATLSLYGEWLSRGEGE